MVAAIVRATERHGHPYDVPLNGLEGIDAETAKACFAILGSEPLPVHPTAATAKWLRLISDFSGEGGVEPPCTLQRVSEGLDFDKQAGSELP